MNRRMTALEQQQGYVVCDCERFAFVFKSELLRWKPADYHGELCRECGQWTCSVEVIKACEEAMKRAEPKELP